MRRLKSRAFTLHEMMVVIGIAAILLTITVISSRKAANNRALDSTAKEFESAISLARESAVASNGSVLEIIMPTAESPGYWKLTAARKSDKIGELASSLVFSMTPSSPNSLTFSSAGTLPTNYTFKLGSRTSSKTVSWKLHGNTGALERLNE